MSRKTHLHVLEDGAAAYADHAVFKLPVLSPDSTEANDWKPINYAQFKSDVERYARYWSRILAKDGLPRRSVVGLWLGGLSYEDVLHIYGVARASYIPQLFSLRLPNPDIVYELLQRGNAQSLIHDPSFSSIVIDSPVPAHPSISVSVDEEDTVSEELVSLTEMRLEDDDVIMIFHTSGSTSGSPKLVRCNLKWLDSMMSKAEKVMQPRNLLKQDVTVWMGSMCHIAQNFMLAGALQHGSCTIQPSVISFPPTELMYMISNHSLNRLNQFASFLATYLRNSRQNPKLLQLLKGLDEILFSGLPLDPEEEQWAVRNGIRLRNVFGNTECGAMLISIGGDGDDARLLRPIEGTLYDFASISATSGSSSPSSSMPAPPVLDHKNANSGLLELVVRSNSDDCPDASLRGPDGHYHTGDLFLEVEPNRYVFRGRGDDWIKSENSLRCDTKAIEDNVMAVCADLVESCIVVGNGRPSPTLFVEPKVPGHTERLKRDIVRRTRPFHTRRYLHEQITATNFVVVVPKGTLPRTATKGNIRRKAVEEAFKELLDRVYGVTTW